MFNRRRIIIVFFFAFLSNIVLLSALAKNKTFPQQRSMRYTSRSKEDAKVWQENVRAKLYQLFKMDNTIQGRNSIPFNAKVLFRADKGTYHITEVEINSTARRRIRAVVTVPNSKLKPFPAIVCIGGHGSSLYSPYAPISIAGQGKRKKSDSIYKGFGTVLAETEYVTISTTVSQHKVYEKGRLLMGERLWDLIRCVDYLQSMPEVDEQRIGCGGLSLGGEMAMWLAAMDERIVATVSSGFLTTMDQMEQNHCMCWKFEGLRKQVDFADIYSLIAPRPLQCQNGILESPTQFYVPLARKAMEEIRVIYKDLGKPENVVLDIHEGGHIIDLLGLIYFFEKHLYNNRWKQIKNPR